MLDRGDINCWEYEFSDWDNWGEGSGWCQSDLDEYIGEYDSAVDCFYACRDANWDERDHLAVDFTPGDPTGSCYCQNECTCTVGDSSQSITTGRWLDEMPPACGDDKVEEMEDGGDN